MTARDELARLDRLITDYATANGDPTAVSLWMRHKARLRAIDAELARVCHQLELTRRDVPRPSERTSD